MKFYATFQQRYSYDTHPVNPDICHLCYLVVEAEDELEARKYMRDNYDNDYAFLYAEAEFTGQPEKWGLHEVPPWTPESGESVLPGPDS